MEYDRYKQHHALYVVGIISLLLSLVFLFFLLYITPYLIWELSYNVPELVVYYISFFQDQYNFTLTQSKFLFWCIFLIGTLVTGYVSYYVSNRIDNELYHDDLEPEDEKSEEEKELMLEREKQELNESLILGFKILGLIIMIVGLVLTISLVI